MEIAREISGHTHTDRQRYSEINMTFLCRQHSASQTLSHAKRDA